MSKARAFVFTVNNYTDADCDNVFHIQTKAQYIVVGKEVGEQGTPHLQGYMYFSSPRNFTAIKKLLPRGHIEVAKAEAKKNREYCIKGGDILVESGVMPTQGARNDIEQVRHELKEGANMRQIVDTAKSTQSIRMAEIYLKYHEKGRDWKPEVKWFHGSTGSGKTRTAREWLEKDIYTCLETGKWWEGYDAHENVLIDDFRKDFCKFHTLLKILDRYEYKVETKGGSRQLLAKKIAITCPYHPAEVYETREDVKQLLRRIDEIICVGDAVHKVTYKFRDFEGEDPLD